MNRKRMSIIISIIVISLLIIIFSFFYYKTIKNGNTMINKSEEEIIEYILNMRSYEAKMNITVETNKNKTNYVVVQSANDKISRQEIIEPKNIAGVITEYDGINLKITNNKLDLSTTFKNYEYMVENRLWLNSFIEEYKNNKETKSSIDENDEIVLEIKNKDDKYNVYKKLYISKQTSKPTKLIIQDINQNTLVYILYTEIEISE